MSNVRQPRPKSNAKSDQFKVTGATTSRDKIPPDAYVIVIGAMKSGTSTLFEYLSLHQQIVGSSVKEPEYFSENQWHGMAVEAYSDLWEFDLDRHRYCIEASTGYTKYPDELHVPERMFATGIEPKFIYAVRNPLDRMESQVNHSLLRRTAWTFDSFFDPGVLNLSRYYMQMQQYLTRFPDRSRYHIVDFDKLVSDPSTTMNEVFRWLELDPIELPEQFHAHKTPTPSRPELLIKDLGLSDSLSFIPETLKRRIQSLLRTHAPAQKRMTHTERRLAESYLEQDIRCFGKTFTFPVEKWGFR